MRIKLGSRAIVSDPQWRKRQSSWYFDQPFGSFHSPTLHETFDGKLNSNRCIVESNAPLVIYFVAELTRGWRDAGIEDVGRGFSWSRWLNNQLHSSPSLSFFFFLLKEKNLIATRSGVRWYIYANCYRTFWKAVKCKIRYGIRLHLLVTRIYGATFLAVCVIELFLRLVTCMILNLCVNEISHEYINYGEKYRKKRTSKNKLKLYLIFFLFLHEMRRK